MGKFRTGKAAAAVGAIFAIGSGTASAAILDYSIDGGVEKNDNIALTSTNQIDRTFLRTGVGFVLNEQSSAIQASIFGRVEYRDYRSSHLDNAVDGTLSGRFNWVALPQRLHFTIEDNLSVQSIDTLAPDTPMNRQQVNVLALGPTLFFRPGKTLHAQAELRYINSDAEVTNQFNSQRVGAALRVIKDFSTTSLLSFNLAGQQVDFDHDTVARDYDRYEAYARYALRLRNIDFGLEGGYSELKYKDGEKRSDPLLRGNATWHLSDRSQFDLSAARMLSDSASDSLRGLAPGGTVPETVLVGNSQITSSAYHVNRFEIGYKYTGTLFGVTVTPYVENRDYIDPGELDQNGRGGRLDMDWRLRRNLVLNLFATTDKTTYGTIDRIDKTHYVGAAVQKDWSRNWSSRLEYANYKRTTSLPGQDVSQNILYLSVIYKNR